MVEDISNKTLVGLLVVAIVISLFGTWISISKISRLSIPVLTGRFGTSGEGTAVLNITEYLAINMTDRNINFGDGKVMDGHKYAKIWSNGSEVNWNATVASGDDYMGVRNVGNIRADIQVKSNVSSQEHGTNESFICQGDAGGCGDVYPESFEFFVVDDNNCLSGANETPTNFTNAKEDYWACRELKVYEEFKFYLYAIVPADAQGIKTAELTFTATSAEEP